MAGGASHRILTLSSLTLISTFLFTCPLSALSPSMVFYCLFIPKIPPMLQLFDPKSYIIILPSIVPLFWLSNIPASSHSASIFLAISCAPPLFPSFMPLSGLRPTEIPFLLPSLPYLPYSPAIGMVPDS